MNLEEAKTLGLRYKTRNRVGREGDCACRVSFHESCLCCALAGGEMRTLAGSRTIPEGPLASGAFAAAGNGGRYEFSDDFGVESFLGDLVFDTECPEDSVDEETPHRSFLEVLWVAEGGVEYAGVFACVAAIRAGPCDGLGFRDGG